MEERKKQPGHKEPAGPATSSIADWLQYLSLERNRSAGTVRVYMGDLNDFARFIAKDCTDSQLLRANLDQLRSYIRTLTGIRRQEPASVRRAIASLRSFYKYAVFTGKARVNPAAEIPLPHFDNRKPRSLPESEVWAILTARVHPDDEQLHQRDRAIFETLYASGIRVFELCNANVDDLNMEGHWIFIPKGKGAKKRYALLNQTALLAIRTYLAVRPARSTKALFVTKSGHRLTTRAIHHAFRLRLRAAGLMPEEKPEAKSRRHDKDDDQEPSAITPHCLRHSCARHMLEHGADVSEVQEMLGHAQITTTQRYITPEMGRLRTVYDQTHPRDRFEYGKTIRTRS